MQDRIKELEVEPTWSKILSSVASCANEDVMVGLDGTLKIKADCMERFAQSVARECQQIADTTIEQGGECAHNTANAIRARFGIEGE